jgi:hypothetical protein
VIELPKSCYFHRILSLGDCRSEPLVIRSRVLDGISPWFGVSWNSKGGLALLQWIGTMDDIFHVLAWSLAFSLCSLAIQADRSSFIAFVRSK